MIHDVSRVWSVEAILIDAALLLGDDFAPVLEAVAVIIPLP
jgi:hypothetical protein